MSQVVYVVHCVDTEGPVDETLTATFERVEHAFGVSIEPSLENLERLRRKEIDLNGGEDACCLMVSTEALAYNNNWAKIDDMLAEALSEGFRNELPDSFGGGWIYSWFCMDHIGYELNPRKRDIGFHNIFEKYQLALATAPSQNDEMGFHIHPLPFNRQGNLCATHHFSNDNRLFEILARRILDHSWFPSCNRPGFHVTRPESHWFWEQFVPFDYASQSYDIDEQEQNDLANGRFGDWRRAPITWRPYRPAHDDYQVEGDCRRWIFRCLNMNSRIRNLRQEDVDLAFAESREGKPVVLSFTDHDYRDIRADVNQVRGLIDRAAKKYPDVQFKYCGAREAARLALGLPQKNPCGVTLTLDNGVFHIRSDSPTFGPQPYFAMKTRDGRYFHDNLDFQKPFFEWSYTFDESTFDVSALEKAGVAACDDTGNVSVAVMDMSSGVQTDRYW